MLRLLLESNARGFQFRQGALVSVVTHTVLIAAAVHATAQGPSRKCARGSWRWRAISGSRNGTAARSSARRRRSKSTPE